jgi:hypothetical protein
MEGVQGHQAKGIAMRQVRKSTVAVIVGLGALALLASPSFAAGSQAAKTPEAPVQLAHMGQSQGGGWSGHPCPMGMMGSGMGGQGMMGSGMGGQGMMGSGMGGQGMMGPSFGNQVVPRKDLAADDVRHFLEHRLEMLGNKRLKVGEVKEADEDEIVADITTVDGSLVQRLKVDRHTGQMQHVE